MTTLCTHLYPSIPPSVSSMFFFSWQGQRSNRFYMCPALPFHLSLLSALTPCHPVRPKMRLLVCSFFLVCIQLERKKKEIDRQTDRQDSGQTSIEREKERDSKSRKMDEETGKKTDFQAACLYRFQSHFMRFFLSCFFF